MNIDDSRSKKVALVRLELTGVGGAERLMFEEAKYFENIGANTCILTYMLDEKALFSNTYSPNIILFNNGKYYKNFFLKVISMTLGLRKKIKEIKPDSIIAQNPWACVILYFATLFTHFQYNAHIHATIFWFSDNPLLKYALIHRKVFTEIRDSVGGRKEFIPLKPPKSSLANRVVNEVIAILMYLSIKKAKKIFVLSNQMSWEVKKLYGKDAFVLKGALPTGIFNYKPKRNIKQKLGLMNKKVILNVNRLDRRKRIDILIKSFKRISEKNGDVSLIIGGTGEEEQTLRNLAKELNLGDNVQFMGYIPEEDLWDYYACCDVFAHPTWADFVIAPYEALALGKKVVVTTEMELDLNLRKSNFIFIADSSVNEFAKALDDALSAERSDAEIKKLQKTLSIYTWDSYFNEMKKILCD